MIESKINKFVCSLMCFLTIELYGTDEKDISDTILAETSIVGLGLHMGFVVCNRGRLKNIINIKHFLI